MEGSKLLQPEWAWELLAAGPLVMRQTMPMPMPMLMRKCAALSPHPGPSATRYGRATNTFLGLDGGVVLSSSPQ
jgi:hypothetical protein